MIPNLEIPIAGGLNVALPKMALVRQRFDDSRLDDVGQAVGEQMQRSEIRDRVRPGMKIAIGAGSRGIANIAEAVKAVVQGLKEQGAEPFIFPAMGSHGGANAEGQQALLEGFGIREDYVGAPIRASMDTVQVSELDDGTPLHVDRLASEADGIVLVNRIKPHTTFRGKIESGVVKMVVIGMGKIQGATLMHWQGMDRFPEVLPDAATRIMAKVPLLFGIGMIENAYDQTAYVEALLPETLIEREMELLEIAKKRMGRLLFSDIDVLVIDQMGKEISGAGFDPNITGRNNRGVEGFGDPRVQKIVVLSLSEKTKGNANGMGLADVITRRLFEERSIIPRPMPTSSPPATSTGHRCRSPWPMTVKRFSWRSKPSSVSSVDRNVLSASKTPSASKPFPFRNRCSRKSKSIPGHGGGVLRWVHERRGRAPAAIPEIAQEPADRKTG